MCLDTLIGNDNACATSTGRLTLDQIGLTESKITNFIREEDGCKTSFLAKIRATVGPQVVSDILTRFSSSIIPHTFLSQTRIGQFNQEQELQTATANTLNGIVVEVCLPQSNVKQVVTKIEFYSATTGDVNIQVYDLKDGKLLGTIALEDCVTGEVKSLAVDLTYYAGRERMRLLFVTAETSWYRSDINLGGCSTCNGAEFRQGGVVAWGCSIDTSVAKKWSNLSKSNFTGGLSIVTAVACDHSAWLCEIKESLALPLMYKQGEEITRYGLFNRTRFNEDNRDKSDLAGEAAWYNGKYEEAIGNLLKSMPNPTDKTCFKCKEMFRTVTMIP